MYVCYMQTNLRLQHYVSVLRQSVRRYRDGRMVKSRESRCRYTVLWKNIFLGWSYACAQIGKWCRRYGASAEECCECIE